MSAKKRKLRPDLVEIVGGDYERIAQFWNSKDEKINRWIEKSGLSDQRKAFQNLVGDLDLLFFLTRDELKAISKMVRKRKLKLRGDYLGSIRSFYEDKKLTRIWGTNREILASWLRVEEEFYQELKKTRSGKLKPFEHEFFRLFWALEDMGFGQTKQIQCIYDLFVEFNFEDYGKETYEEKKDLLIGEPEQKDRIRKIQEKAMRSRPEIMRMEKRL